MDYQEFLPRKEIRHLVECFWSNRLYEEDIRDGFDIIIPDGATEAMIMINGSYLRKEEHLNSEYLIEECKLVTPFDKAVKVYQKAGTMGIGIRFKPGAIQKLTGYSLQELDESAYPLEFLMPELSDLSMNEVQKGAQVKELIKKLTDMLVSYKIENERNHLIHIFISHTLKNRGNVSIKEFCDIYGIHKSTLEKNFKHNTGLTPKQYARIVRHNYLLNLIITTQKPFTEICYELGFYDQSHMIKDFTSFLGHSPSDFIEKKFTIPTMMATAVVQRSSYYSY